MAEKIVVIGGGIGGLSVAHHLVRAGVDGVHMYEASDRVGGKAKSQYVDVGAAAPYPGEHGFRFFPHFYRHIVDTMATTPAGGGTVLDRLVGASDAGVAFDRDLSTIARTSEPLEAFRFVTSVVRVLQDRKIQLDDVVRYAGVLLRFATSCQERRDQEYDRQPWTEFAHADSFSDSFDALVIKASRNLSAMRAAESSAATIGSISLQMIFDFEPKIGRLMDPLLRGPTDETWLEPWLRHLEAAGVTFHFEKPLTAFDFDDAAGRLRSVRFGAETVAADHYVCAVPLECVVPLLSAEMCAFDPSLARLASLAPRARGDMIGLQFFLRRDVPIVRGHVHYPRTPFALTSVSQAQFWSPKPDARPGTPELKGVISAIISDWQSAGSEGLKASEYTDRNRLLEEVWRQIEGSLPVGAVDRGDVIAMHLDQNVRLGPFANDTPLLVHPVGQLALRPDAATRIANLYLASDYVRTHTDLATMEGADEAARRAAGAILAREGVPAERRPFVKPLTEGPVFEAAKRLDAALFEAGLPHAMAAGERVHDHAVEIEGRAIDALQRVVTALPLHPRIDWRRPDPAVFEHWGRVLTRP